MRTLNLPLNERDVKKLKLGEVISVNGPMVTGRDEVHIRALERAKDGGEIPKVLTGSTLYHCGPIMKKVGDGWVVLAAGPTTSARMNKLEAEFIRKFKIRAIIGKGGMSKEVAEAMKESGCVYLAATGGTAVTLADELLCTGVEWEDLGMAEAMWLMEANNFGPLVVAIDSKGNSIYDQVAESLKR
jgi:fumarate hydratase subunit beta